MFHFPSSLVSFLFSLSSFLYSPHLRRYQLSASGFNSCPMPGPDSAVAPWRHLMMRVLWFLSVCPFLSFFLFLYYVAAIEVKRVHSSIGGWNSGRRNKGQVSRGSQIRRMYSTRKGCGSDHKVSVSDNDCVHSCYRLSSVFILVLILLTVNKEPLRSVVHF